MEVHHLDQPTLKWHFAYFNSFNFHSNLTRQGLSSSPSYSGGVRGRSGGDGGHGSSPASPSRRGACTHLLPPSLHPACSPHPSHIQRWKQSKFLCDPKSGVRLYLKERGPEPHSFLSALLGSGVWSLSYLLWTPCCPLSFPAWSRWTQTETERGKRPQRMSCETHKRDSNNGCVPPGSCKGDAGCREAGRQPGP